MPLPNRGCQTCKIRRIKCDETRPTCQRCRKSQRICLRPDTSQPHFSIHLENRYASGDTKRPRGPRSTSMSRPSNHNGGGNNNNNNTLVREPRLDLATRALLHYFHFHLQIREEAPGLTKTLYDCVATQVSSSKPQSEMVHLAISSFSLAVYSRTHHYAPAATQASVQYHNLLQVARSILPTLDRENIDSCLFAICLMGRYEDTVYRPNNFAAAGSFPHHDGALAVLKVWSDFQRGRSQPPPQPPPQMQKQIRRGSVQAPGIVQQARRGLIRSALMRALALPRWASDGSLFGESGLDLIYDRIIIAIADLRHRLKHTTDYFELEELNGQAAELDDALRRWSIQFPSSWAYERHVLAPSGRPSRSSSPSSSSPFPSDHFYSSTVYAYASPFYAVAWLQYFSTRMLLASARLRILRLLIQACRPDPAMDNILNLDLSPLTAQYDEQRRKCWGQLKAMAEALAASIPCCLDLVKLQNKVTTEPPTSPDHATAAAAKADAGRWERGPSGNGTTIPRSTSCQDSPDTSPPLVSGGYPSTSSISPVSVSTSPPGSSDSPKAVSVGVCIKESPISDPSLSTFTSLDTSTSTPISSSISTPPLPLPLPRSRPRPLQETDEGTNGSSSNTETDTDTNTKTATTAASPLPTTQRIISTALHDQVQINPYLAVLVVWPLTIGSYVDTDMDMDMNIDTNLNTDLDTDIDMDNAEALEQSKNPDLNRDVDSNVDSNMDMDMDTTVSDESTNANTNTNINLKHLQTWFRSELGRAGKTVGAAMLEGAVTDTDEWLKM